MKPFILYGIIAAFAMIGGFFCLITGIAGLKKEHKFLAIGLIIVCIPLFYAAYALSVKSDQLKGVTPKTGQHSTK
jgi:hypothetical protein